MTYVTLSVTAFAWVVFTTAILVAAVEKLTR